MAIKCARILGETFNLWLYTILVDIRCGSVCNGGILLHFSCNMSNTREEKCFIRFSDRQQEIFILIESAMRKTAAFT